MKNVKICPNRREPTVYVTNTSKIAPFFAVWKECKSSTLSNYNKVSMPQVKTSLLFIAYRRP